MVVPDLADGIAITPSGQYIMCAQQSTGFFIIDMLPAPHVVYTVFIAGADGIALGRGPALAGKAYVNTNFGYVIEVVYDTDPTNGIEFEPPVTPIHHPIAMGGSRGDFIAVDVYVPCRGTAVRYPSLLLTQTDSIVRMDPLDNGWFGPPFNVESAIHVDQSFCFGDGTLATNCPCSNLGMPGHGCDNSTGNGGSILSVFGSTVPDTMVLVAANEYLPATSIFMQGSSSLANGVVFGDGVLCVGGLQLQLAVKSAVNGHVVYPDVSEQAITLRSTALGDPIQPGTSRYYQVLYRDPAIAFCGGVADAFNMSNAIRIDW
jgi:hypothetical protein